MRKVRRFVEEQVMDNDQLHCSKPRRDMLRIGIGLQEILALDIDRTERTVDRGDEHVRDAQPRPGIEADAPIRLEAGAPRTVGNMANARQVVRGTDGTSAVEGKEGTEGEDTG